MTAQRQTGLTLLELLIAITLLAVTLSLAYAVLRTALRSDERVIALIADGEQQRASEAFLRRHLRGIRPLFGEENDDGVSPLLFQGQPQSLDYIAPVPARQPQLAGLQAFRLSLKDGQLLLHINPAEDFGGSSATPRVLLDALEAAHFEYYGERPRQRHADWSPAWTSDDRLPRLLRLSWQVEGQPRALQFAIPAGISAGAATR